METIKEEVIKEIYDQLDDYEKIEYLEKALQDATKYYPEFVTKIELIGWQMNYKMEKDEMDSVNRV